VRVPGNTAVHDDRRRTLNRILLRWYARHGRSLPWRDVDNPYYVLISEFMLQQTQVARVMEHFPRWIARFPTVAKLAAARRREVLLAWSGLGYNRRALYLHAAAQEIMRRHGGRIPDDVEALHALPGFGRYTAHAVACFGYYRRLPVVDVNVRRVLSRLARNMKTDTNMLAEPDVWDIASALLPPRAHYNWNQALMDLGATVCTARRPSCDMCPLRGRCPSAGRLAPGTPFGRHAASHGTAAPDPGTVSSGTTASMRGTDNASTPAAVRETPRRIHRGRLIEHLRRCSRHCDNGRRLCSMLFDRCGKDERARLLDILASLQRDGMIRARAHQRVVQDIRAFAEPLDILRICLTD